MSNSRVRKGIALVGCYALLAICGSIFVAANDQQRELENFGRQNMRAPGTGHEMGNILNNIEIYRTDVVYGLAILFWIYARATARPRKKED